MSLEDETLSPVPPELQAEFDEWEAISDETMRKFEAGITAEADNGEILGSF